ncbi:TRAP transporter small permease [Trichloromonas sp.]|uniref:TRAP transporter small permease n=1 Tax=Trichloromonas sp. TaxID=3069249 RepID=UPI003D813A75
MLKRIFKTVDRTIAAIEDWSLFLTVSAALLAAMANVILRKTTHINLYWSDELVRKVIFFTTFIGCSAAVRHRSLIRIDALPQMFPVLKRPLTLFSHLVVLLFASTMIWLGLQLTRAVYADEYARSATLQIPEWYFYAVLPLMGGMMFLRTLIVMVEDWRGLSNRTSD